MRRSTVPHGVFGPPLDNRGFTLVELMITIVVVAVLSSIALFAYTRHIKSTRDLEARTILNQIQSQQEAYFETHGQYCNVSGNAGFYPLLTGEEPSAKIWNPQGALLSGWNALGVRPDGGRVFFSYKVSAGEPPNFTVTAEAQSVGVPEPEAGNSLPWYYAIARGDMDGSGAPFTEVTVSSHRQEPVIRNKGK